MRSALLLVSAFFAAAASASKTQVAVNSLSDFCLFLPPKPGMEIAPNEDIGISFCLKPSTISGSKALPAGFIKTAHFLKTSTYVQLTGWIDRTKYKLKSSDGGGQYDNHGNGKPVGAVCKNYNYFVELIEPDINRFCIRCCQNKADCPTGRSGYGCLRVVPGDYSHGKNTTSTSLTGSTSTTNSKTSTTTKKTTTTKKSSTKTQTATTTAKSAAKTSTTATATPSLAHNNAEYEYVLEEMDQAGMTYNEAAQYEEPQYDSAIDAFPDAIQTIKDQIAQQVPVDEIKSQFTGFLHTLADEFPESAADIQRLESVTAQYSTYEDWDHFVQVLEYNL
ncbi:hypothetical protein VTP01DRAFT_6136 [Rhizomucor pusillus]|uniref:uncharacterized protein n=1 Tax=Rhizomucor pusillus TaxID=4840 RepID=UPI003742D439